MNVSAWVFQGALGLIGCGAFWFLLRHVGLMHFGLALYAAVGAFATVFWMRTMANLLPVDLQVAFAPVVAACAAWCLAALLSRLLIKRSGLTFAMLSLAVGEVAHVLAPMWPQVFGGEAGLGISRGHMNHAELAAMAVAWAWLCVLGWKAWRKRPVALWAAVHRDREERLALWGVDAFKVRFQTHGLACAALGLWGGLAALWLEHVSVQMLDPTLSAWLLLFAWMGGPSVWGLLLGVCAWTVFRLSAGTWTDSMPLWLGVMFVGVTWWRAHLKHTKLQPRHATGIAVVDATVFQPLEPAKPVNRPASMAFPDVAVSPALVLQLRQVSVTIDHSRLLQPVELSLVQGEWVGIQGVNGAGKSTLLKAITGELPIDPAGQMVWMGQDIASMPVFERARLGITRSHQSPALFEHMSVLEHVMAAWVSGHHATLRSLQRPTTGGGSSCPVSHQVDHWRGQALHWLSRVGMEHCADQPISRLSYAQQRMLECVMTAAFGPRLVLLDEPTAGLNSAERQQMCDAMGSLFENTTCLIVEHDPDVLSRLCSRMIEIHPC